MRWPQIRPDTTPCRAVRASAAKCSGQLGKSGQPMVHPRPLMPTVIAAMHADRLPRAEASKGDPTAKIRPHIIPLLAFPSHTSTQVQDGGSLVFFPCHVILNAAAAAAASSSSNKLEPCLTKSLSSSSRSSASEASRLKMTNRGPASTRSSWLPSESARQGERVSLVLSGPSSLCVFLDKMDFYGDLPFCSMLH